MTKIIGIVIWKKPNELRTVSGKSFIKLFSIALILVIILFVTLYLYNSYKGNNIFLFLAINYTNSSSRYFGPIAQGMPEAENLYFFYA
jgi:hypothetical protein